MWRTGKALRSGSFGCRGEHDTDAARTDTRIDTEPGRGDMETRKGEDKVTGDRRRGAAQFRTMS